MSEKEESKSPRRKLIMKMLKKKSMTAAQVAEVIGITREAAYNVLLKMAACNQVRKIDRASQVFWGAYKPKVKIIRETQVHNGTMTERLSLSYMQTPVRAGSMDAFAIESNGIGA